MAVLMRYGPALRGLRVGRLDQSNTTRRRAGHCPVAGMERV